MKVLILSTRRMRELMTNLSSANKVTKWKPRTTQSCANKTLAFAKK